MILINVRFRPRPEYVENFRELVGPFTEATRAEPGNLFFDWARNTDDPGEYLLMEAFTDDGAGPHVESEHFKQACIDLPNWLSETPQIINTLIDGKEGWDEMAEFQVPGGDVPGSAEADADSNDPMAEAEAKAGDGEKATDHAKEILPDLDA